MKKIIFGLLLLPLTIIAQNKGVSGFTITGTVKGLGEKSKVFLTDANNPTDTIAKGFVKTGSFVLSGHVNEPNVYELTLGSPKNKYMLFIGNDKVKIEGAVDNIKELKVSGSP